MYPIAVAKLLLNKVPSTKYIARVFLIYSHFFMLLLTCRFACWAVFGLKGQESTKDHFLPLFCTNNYAMTHLREKAREQLIAQVFCSFKMHKNIFNSYMVQLIWMKTMAELKLTLCTLFTLFHFICTVLESRATTAKTVSLLSSWLTVTDWAVVLQRVNDAHLLLASDLLRSKSVK